MTPDERIAKRERRAWSIMTAVAVECAETLRRLYLPDGDPNQHPDAKKTWSECSMQTRAALALAKAHGENPQADVKELFGIIVVQGRSKSAHEWEQRALEVERRQKERAIEALAVSKLEPAK